jgi:hypothetical protein
LDVPAFSLSKHNSSAQLPSRMPAELLSTPSSGSIWAVWSHLSSCSMTGPMPFCTVAPAPSPSESGPRTRSSPSAASRPAWPRTPSLAARVAAADSWVRAQAVLMQSSGSCSQTPLFLHLPLWSRHKMVPEPFSYPARRFLHARDGRHHHRLHRLGTHPVNGHHHKG